MTRSSREQPDDTGGTPAEGRAPVDVTFLGHATVLINMAGVRVLTDPFLRTRIGPLQRHGPVPDPATLEADVVVISHGHRDHFDRRSIEALAGRPQIVMPRGLASALPRE